MWPWHLLLLAALVGAWWALTKTEILPPFFFGEPAQVALRIADWFSTGKIFPHLGVTLLETLLAFAIGTLAGLGVGLWLGLNAFAARLLDPDAFVLCAACLKTHNVVIATLSVKNMALGAPLRSAPKTPRSEQFNDKRKYHGGVRQTHYDIMLTAQKMAPFWGATVIDGYDGMEGNGPSSGTPVPSRIAIASTDYIAADRVGVEAMGVNPEWIGCLKFCHQAGIGQYDIAKIDIRGEKIASIKKEYRLHRDIERELRWMGPMEEVPEKLG